MSTRIVFVDDELNILQAMGRSFHGMRNEWNMEFLSSGAAALQSLAKAPADVIVSDMRMPGMDGWQLLAEVKRLYPQTVRLVLSGQADPSSVMRAVGTAQLYLAKPCESGALKAAIVQTQMLRQLLSSDRLALLVGEVGMLPSAPTAFQEILVCMQNPAASLTDAAQIIGRDVAMTANIMKLVNSAFFGSRRPITTIDRAVAYLGMDTLGALVLGHSVFQSGVATGIDGFSLEQLWQHTEQTAAAARAIALSENLSLAKADEAFLAGVLHDVGKVVFATKAAALPNDTMDVVTQMETHHAVVGAYLLGLWGFPNSIVEAVAFHHTPDRASEKGFGLSGIVHVADRLVHLRSEHREASIDTGLQPGYLESLGLEHCLPKWSAALQSLDDRKAAA
ncbi:MAG TPA: response regulator [Steroidobacteraceae bacterium]|jgi:putative nucleotidyltransferase with HDIG domain|nr:response regulator [Steroidobacteraceae bacterium]